MLQLTPQMLVHLFPTVQDMEEQPHGIINYKENIGLLGVIIIKQDISLTVVDSLE